MSEISACRKFSIKMEVEVRQHIHAQSKMQCISLKFCPPNLTTEPPKPLPFPVPKKKRKKTLKNYIIVKQAIRKYVRISMYAYTELSSRSSLGTGRTQWSCLTKQNKNSPLIS